MTSLPAGGTRSTRQLAEPISRESTATRCQCCPYGYHIDLDFVKFAENVTAGTEYAQKWNTGPRRRTHQRSNITMDDSLPRSQSTQITHFRAVQSCDASDDWVSPMDISFVSQSTAGGLQSEDEFPTHDLTLSYSSNYLARNHSDSHVLKLINELNSLENAARKPPLPPPISSSTPHPPADRSNATANAELREIFSRTPTIGATRSNMSEFARNVTSAPTSPIPSSNYHSVVAQAATRKHSVPERKHVSVTSSAIQNPPTTPKRYIDAARPRVLSPEPVRDASMALSAMRTSNLHNRVFYTPVDSAGANERWHVKSNASTGTASGVDFNSFASVRRQRAFSPPPHRPLPRSDGYTSDVEYQSRRFVKSSAPAQTVKPPAFVIEKQTMPVNCSVATVSKQPPMEILSLTTQFEQKPLLKDATTITTAMELPKQPPRTPTLHQEVQVGVESATVCCDTVDLEVPKVMLPDLSIEFQFSLGHEPEHHPNEEPKLLTKQFMDAACDPIRIALFSVGINTDAVSTADKACMPMPPPVRPKTAEKSCETDSTPELATVDTQTPEADPSPQTPQSNAMATQTGNEWMEAAVASRLRAEREERRSVDKVTETEEEMGEFIMITCSKCDQSSHANAHEQYEKIPNAEEPTQPHLDSIADHESGFSNSSTDLEEFEKLEQSIMQESAASTSHELPPEPLIRNSFPPEPDFSDHDHESLDAVSINTMIMVEPLKEETGGKTVDSSKVEAIRKLLTEPTRQPFSRESGAYRSYRTDKSKTTDDLDFIVSRHHHQENDSHESSTPSEGSQAALTDVVMLKKVVPFVSTVPEPVFAKIPRPKISRYNVPEEQAITPDEEAEAADRLTPLRSDLRSLAAWRNSGGPYRSVHDAKRYGSNYGTPQPIEEDEVEGEVQNSGASSDSDATYDLSDEEEEAAASFEMTAPLKEALETLNEHLKEPEAVAVQAADWATKYIQHEWLKRATKRRSCAVWVEKFLDALECYSVALMEVVVNFVDGNGNTALHYAVSHENYDLVSVLLDSKVCDVDKMNHAGYSPVMLGSLCEIENETHSTIIQRLFEIGNVNAKALKHNQTALQLAASHGRIKTTELLLACGADVNIQDVDGSTALMCAAEHGHKEIIKMLLKNPNIDASLTDCDNQTALSIAVDQKHKAIAVLIYAHLNFTRSSGDNTTTI